MSTFFCFRQIVLPFSTTFLVVENRKIYRLKNLDNFSRRVSSLGLREICIKEQLRMICKITLKLPAKSCEENDGFFGVFPVILQFLLIAIEKNSPRHHWGEN